jgi:peptidoglycan/xylan/chitin deacetylase (PgdA/CDA1 family)
MTHRHGTSRLLGATALLAALSCAAPPARHATKHASAVVPILVYHSVAPHHPGQTRDQRILDVDPKVFERQLDRIQRDSISVISMGQLVDALAGRATLPRRSIVITFDDGWESQYKHAYPALRKRGMSATFFVITKDISHDSISMTWPQLKEMARAGMTIGSHTRTHPELIDRHTGLRWEIGGSIEDLRQQLGARPAFFAYPFCEFNARAESVVRADSFVAARSCDRGVENGPRDRYALNAVFVTDDSTKFQQLLDLASGRISALPPRMASAARHPHKKNG